MAATAIAPIGAQQINRNLYVGQSDFTTIQDAVDFAESSGGAYAVVIPAGYQGSDPIAAVSGGSATVYLSDQRGSSTQNYVWNGTSYIPADQVQFGNIRGMQKIRAYGFSLPDHAASNLSIGVGGDGHTPTLSFLNASAPADQQIWLFGASATSFYISATADNGQDNGFIVATRNGTNVTNINIIGPVTMPISLAVAGSPVRTFANTPDAVGEVYPGVGIGVSTGSAWGASIDPASLPTLAGNNTFAGSNIFTAANSFTKGAAFQSGLGTSHVSLQMTSLLAPVLNIWSGPSKGYLDSFGADISTYGEIHLRSYNSDGSQGRSQLDVTNTGVDAPVGLSVAGSAVRTFANTPNATAQVYPGAGLGVSTGSAWGASIDPATLQHTLTLTTTGSSGPATLVGSTLNIPQYSGGTGMVFPGAGIGVSTGSAWGASINPASLPTLAGNNAFTGANSFVGVTASNLTVSGGSTLDSTLHDFDNSGATSGWFAAAGWSSAPVWAPGTRTISFPLTGGINSGSFISTQVYNGLVMQYYPTIGGSTGQDISLASQFQQSGGNWISLGDRIFHVEPPATFASGLTTAGALINNLLPAPAGANTFAIQEAGGTAYLDSMGPDAATVGKIALRTLSSDLSIVNYALTIDAALALFSIPVAAHDNLSVRNPNVTHTLSCGNVASAAVYGCTIGWNWAVGQGETDFTNVGPPGQGGFKWFNAPIGGAVPPPIMELSGAGNLALAGDVTAKSFIAFSPGEGNLLTGPSGPFLRATWGNGGANGYIDAGGPDSSTYGLISFRLATSVIDTIHEVFSIANTTVNSNVFLVAHQGAQVQGDLNVTGTITAGTKSFAVAHPFDQKKELIHACLEGPENGVFYRGETLTYEGMAEVTLPAYFEALTYPDDRSILLTQLLYRDGQKFSAVAASRIDKGKFRIFSSEPSIVVAWEVKAVRRIGVDGKLAVEIEKRKLAKEAA